MPHVARINTTPVKSTSLHHPDQVFLSEHGVEGDHRFLFLNQEGTRLTEGEKAPLLGIRADHDPESEVLTLSFPDGSTVQGSALAEGDPVPVKLYDRSVEVRKVDGALAGAASRYAGRTLTLARVDWPEYAGGTRRVSLVSAASLDDLGWRGGLETAPDPRRFRMLLEIDGCAPYEEDAWEGRALAVGEAKVRIAERMPRCALTTMHPDTGHKDFPTLKVLATYRRVGQELLFGVYGDVERAGRVRAGDEIRLLDAG